MASNTTYNYVRFTLPGYTYTGPHFPYPPPANYSPEYNHYVMKCHQFYYGNYGLKCHCAYCENARADIRKKSEQRRNYFGNLAEQYDANKPEPLHECDECREFLEKEFQEIQDEFNWERDDDLLNEAFATEELVEDDVECLYKQTYSKSFDFDYEVLEINDRYGFENPIMDLDSYPRCSTPILDDSGNASIQENGRYRHFRNGLQRLPKRYQVIGEEELKENIIAGNFGVQSECSNTSQECYVIRTNHHLIPSED